MVTEGCEVYGSVEHSVLFAGVVVEKGANIVDSVICLLYTSIQTFGEL